MWCACDTLGIRGRVFAHPKFIFSVKAALFRKCLHGGEVGSVWDESQVADQHGAPSADEHCDESFVGYKPHMRLQNNLDKRMRGKRSVNAVQVRLIQGIDGNGKPQISIAPALSNLERSRVKLGIECPYGEDD